MASTDNINDINGSEPQDSFITTDSDADINVASSSDMFVSKKVHADLLHLKCEYIRHVQRGRFKFY